MSVLTDYVVRGVAILVLLIVVAAGMRGIWLFARPSSAILIRPFDVIDGGKFQAGQAEIVARMLAARIRHVDGILTVDLRDKVSSADGSTVVVDSIVPRTLKLAPDVAGKLDVEFRPFNFDVIGLLSFAARFMHRGPVLHGVMISSDKTVELIVECVDETGKTSLGPWSIKAARDVGESVDDLAHGVVRSFRAASASQLGSFRDKDFRTFVSAVADYQEFVRSGDVKNASPVDVRLVRAVTALKQVAQYELAPGIVYAYLGSIYTILGRPEDARIALEAAVARNPGDRFAAETLARVKGALAAKPIPVTAPVAPVRPSTATGTAQVSSPLLRALLGQPALNLVHVQEAQAEAPNMIPVTVAVLADPIVPIPALQDVLLPGTNTTGPKSAGTDVQGHATTVASLIAAIAPSVRLVPIGVLDTSGTGATSSLLEGLEAIMKSSDVRIVVMPFGYSRPSKILESVFEDVQKRGILLIAPAGNSASSEPSYPAANKGVLAVAATDNFGMLAKFSAFGPWVALAAPGVDVTALGPNGSVKLSGTSFSAAIVTGVAALVASVRPDLKAGEIAEILKKSAIKDPVPEGQRDPQVRRVDAQAAVHLALSGAKVSSLAGRGQGGY